jgi:CPA2 family monovalent cation:H+ antiporter-2
LSNLGTEGVAALAGVGVALLKALIFLGGTALLATRGIPALLERVTRTGSRELFLLAAICLCLLAGYTADFMGLGIALGAFLAGMVVSASGYAPEVFNQVRPLRDVFAAVFFVSVGMLLDPRFVAAHWPVIAGVLLTILIGKPLVTMIPLSLLGVQGRTTFLVGLGLAQIGEFSFVLATLGAARGLVEQEVAKVILSAALLSILIAPFVYGAAGQLYLSAMRIPALARLFSRSPDEANPAIGHEGTGTGNRVIVIGAGRVGRYVSDALRAKDLAHVVVDYDGNAVARLRQNGVPIVFGDATSETVLEQAEPEQAPLAVIALPEATTTEMTLRQLKQMAPKTPVLVRVHRGIDIPRMRAAGADAVIHAEFEAGTEMIRQGLDRLGLPDSEVDAYLEDVRQYRYRHEEE